MVTRRTFATAAVETLTKAGVEDAAFDVQCLLEDFVCLPHGTKPDDILLTAEQYARLQDAVTARANGRPLQYILGNWDFLTLTLAVGDGVLIPRADTEILCTTAAEHLQQKDAPRILDLCAGSGCVGLGIASLCPAVTVTAVEKSAAAFAFLQQNCAAYPQYAVTPVQADILQDAAAFDGAYDAIVSNPPYIQSDVIATLQREVGHEPRMALDGGADGLCFYRVLADTWAKKLANGGFLAVEIGYDQGAAVKHLFEQHGLKKVQIIRDFADNDRVIIGFRCENAQK